MRAGIPPKSSLLPSWSRRLEHTLHLKLKSRLSTHWDLDRHQNLRLDIREKTVGPVSPSIKRLLHFRAYVGNSNLENSHPASSVVNSCMPPFPDRAEHSAGL